MGDIFLETRAQANNCASAESDFLSEKMEQDLGGERQVWQSFSCKNRSPCRKRDTRSQSQVELIPFLKDHVVSVTFSGADW